MEKGLYMKKLNLTIRVCAECPYFDDMAIDVDEPIWCVKHQRELGEVANVPDWCTLEDSDDEI